MTQRADHSRIAWQAYERVVRLMLSRPGQVGYGPLNLVRMDLVRGLWRDVDGLPPEIAPRRRLLLSDVCTQMARLKGWRRWPFASDLIDLQVPDDLSAESPQPDDRP